MLKESRWKFRHRRKCLRKVSTTADRIHMRRRWSPTLTRNRSEVLRNRSTSTRTNFYKKTNSFQNFNISISSSWPTKVTPPTTLKTPTSINSKSGSWKSGLRNSASWPLQRTESLLLSPCLKMIRSNFWSKQSEEFLKVWIWSRFFQKVNSLEKGFTG